jgi:hypothetical protein
MPWGEAPAISFLFPPPRRKHEMMSGRFGTTFEGPLPAHRDILAEVPTVILTTAY